MSFTASTFVCYAATPGQAARFGYQTNDSSAGVAASGYFNNATSNLRQYDIIEHMDIDTATFQVLQVTSTTGAATVTTAAILT